MIKVGSLWNSPDFKTFKVFDIVNDGSNTWVHYHIYEANKSDKNQPRYSCFEEAFVYRFREQVV